MEETLIIKKKTNVKSAVEKSQQNTETQKLSRILFAFFFIWLTLTNNDYAKF